ncbi:MAG: tetratricopeptide repeat protein [Candidatus Obscuribacterales bacterium]
MKLTLTAKASALSALLVALSLPTSFPSAGAIAASDSKENLSTNASARDGYWRTFLEQGQKQLASKSLTEAEVSFRQALRSIKREPHSVDDLVLCMKSLADLLQMEDFKEESWKLYRQALRRLEREYGKDSAKLLPILVTMGSVTEFEGEYKKAAVLYQRAADLARAHLGAQSFELASCLHHLGHAIAQDGPFSGAEENYRSALSIMMAQTSLSSSDCLLELLSDYIDLLHKYTGPAKILTSQYEKELLKDQVQDLGKTRAVPQSAWQQELLRQKQNQNNSSRIVIENAPENSTNLETFSTVAQLLSTLSSSPEFNSFATPVLDRGNGEDQIDYFERMVAIDVKTLGPNHPSVARDLKGLAAVYVTQHRYSEARPLLEQALKIYQSVYAADDLSVQRLRLLLSLISEQALAAAGNSSTTDSASGSADLVAIPLQAQTFEVAQRLNELAFLDYSQGKLEDARNHYAYALSSISNATGRQSVFVAACLQDYLLVMLSSGRKEEADKMQLQARSILAEALSAQLLRAYK